MMNKKELLFGKSSTASSNLGMRPEGHTVASMTTDEEIFGESIGVKRDRSTKYIALDRIIVKEQVRTHFDESKIRELAHSLEIKGQQQAIVVYWSDDDDRYVVICGERRYRAAKMACFETLRCTVHPHKPSSGERVELQLIENAIRSDLNPIEEANSYKELQVQYNESANQVAQRIGKNQSTISRFLRLLSLPDNIQQKIAAGEIPTSVAREMVKLKNDEEQQAMAERYLTGKLTTAQAQVQIAKKSGRGAAKNNKKWTRGKISISATYPKSVTQVEVAEALEKIAMQLRSDGRSKKVAA